MTNLDKKLLTIKNLTVIIDKQAILKNLNLTIKPNEIHTIMGPNGSGKSTLALTLAGHPNFQNYLGNIKLLRSDLKKMPPEQRAAKGIFLSFQQPLAIPGVSVLNVLRASLNSLRKSNQEQPIGTKQFFQFIRPILVQLKLNSNILSRSFNEGFSGGERKKLEILQFILLKPKLAIFDEIDSGLDVDALKLICKSINSERNKSGSVLIITHYTRILKYLKTDYVHILKNGSLVKSGDKKLAQEIERRGFEKL